MIDLAFTRGIFGSLNGQCQPAVGSEFSAGVLLPGGEMASVLVGLCTLAVRRPLLEWNARRFVITQRISVLFVDVARRQDGPVVFSNGPKVATNPGIITQINSPPPKHLTEVNAGVLFAQNFICLGVDLLFVTCAQFALMLHLNGAGLRITRVAFVGHRKFALLGQAKFLAWLRVLFRGCKLCHSISPLSGGCTRSSVVTLPRRQGI
jgi:hypothetical protein